MSDYANIEKPRMSARTALLIYAALMLPAYVNDFTFIALAGSQLIYLADYAWRIATLLAALVLAREIAFARERSRRGPLASWLAAVFAFLFGLAVMRYVDVWVDRHIEGYDLFQYPFIEYVALYWLDLTIGLLLVAFSEEIVCRRVAFRALAAAGLNFFWIVIVSSLAFALMHWGKGPSNIVSTFFTGVIFMLLYRYTGRLWPVVIAHWAMNFIIFM